MKKIFYVFWKIDHGTQFIFWNNHCERLLYNFWNRVSRIMVENKKKKILGLLFWKTKYHILNFIFTFNDHAQKKDILWRCDIWGGGPEAVVEKVKSWEKKLLVVSEGDVVTWGIRRKRKVLELRKDNLVFLNKNKRGKIHMKVHDSNPLIGSLRAQSRYCITLSKWYGSLECVWYFQTNIWVNLNQVIPLKISTVYPSVA